jgi:hypothetical protein
MAVTIPDIFPVAFQNHRASTLASALHQPGDPPSDTLLCFEINKLVLNINVFLKY